MGSWFWHCLAGCVHRLWNSASTDDMAIPHSLGVSCSTGLAHPLFSPSHLASKTPPPLYLAADGRRPDLPGGLAGARGGLSTSVSREKACLGRWAQAGWPECGPQFSFSFHPFSTQRGLYGSLQSPCSAAAPGPPLGSFPFLPAGPPGIKLHLSCCGRYPFTFLLGRKLASWVGQA